MNKKQSNIDRDEFLSLTADILDAENHIHFNSGGISMFPLLKEGDKLHIQKAGIKNLSKGDIVVCTINQKTIGHRIIDIINNKGNYHYKTQGDNCAKADPIFKGDAIIGIVIGFTRNGKNYSFQSFGYRLFRFLILYFSFIVRPSIRIIFTVSRLIKKIKETIGASYSNIQLIGKNSKRLILINSIIALSQGILPFAIIYCLKRLIDLLSKLQSTHDALQVIHLEMLIAATGFVFLFNLIINSWGNYVREKLSQSISVGIYALLHSKHPHLEYHYLEDPEQQDKIHRATVEAGFRPNKLVQAALSLLRSVTAAIIVIVIMFNIHWIIVVILTLGLLPGLYMKVRFSRMMYKLQKEQTPKERQAYYYNQVLTGIPFAKELRLFDTAKVFSSLFNTIQTTLNREKNNIHKKQLYSELISQSIAIILLFGSFGFVSVLAIKGSITIGTVVLFFLVFQRGFIILKELFQSVSSLYEDNIFFADFVSFLHLPSISTTQNDEPTTIIKQAITCNDVSFQYPSSSRLALQHISITIPAGKTIALVGANGSGKTTLVKLLCGFYEPSQGTITFDETVLTASNQTQTRKGITAVFQDFALYNMTAAQNIWLGNSAKPLDMEKVKQASVVAGIDSSLETLPSGYQNMIGNFFEKGEELSIGQWQKLAIARAFYRNSNIVLMDEPSSALDTETEIQLIDSLKTLAKDKTVLIVSHRFSTIQWVDCIYVMENGGIIESGNHDELMSRKGNYYRMYTAQKSL
jgi:ATP-binding cassette subfamily B protein